MATILVTGGAGYVGSHACKALAAAGHRPVTYDNLCRGHRELVKWGPLEIGDVTDPARLGDVMARHKPAAVMHFAALALVGESVANPQEYHRVNVGGTETLLKAMAAAGIRIIIVSGSCAVYGTPAQIPIVEDMFCDPINPYGRTKLLMEQAVGAAEKTQSLSWVSLRYFNAAGADPAGDTGEWHDPEPHLIPCVLAVAAGREPVFTINGDDYSTPDGTCIRDYVHVTDLAEAHVRAFDFALRRDAGGSVFNLGAGTGHSVREVVDVARAVTGRDIPVKIGPRRAGDPPRLVADAGKARTALGWMPRRSDLKSQIADAWAWHKARS